MPPPLPPQPSISGVLSRIHNGILHRIRPVAFRWPSPMKSNKPNLTYRLSSRLSEVELETLLVRCGNGALHIRESRGASRPLARHGYRTRAREAKPWTRDLGASNFTEALGNHIASLRGIDTKKLRKPNETDGTAIHHTHRSVSDVYAYMFVESLC